MKRIGLFLFIGIVAIAGALWLLSLSNPSPSNSTAFDQSEETNNTMATASDSPNAAPVSSSQSLPPKDWQQSFHRMSQQMSALAENPDQVDQEITEFAESLTEPQLKELYAEVTSPVSSGDDRLLAAELLARSPLSSTVDLLKKIAMSSPQELSNVPMIQQEYRAIQLLAIEGLSEKPALQKESQKALRDLASSTSDPLLLDRIQRSLWALQGKAPSPEKQDKEALKKVLEK